MTKRLVTAALLLILAGCTTLRREAQPYAIDEPGQAPADLQLSDAKIAESEALSNFAWGFFLQLSEDSTPDDYQPFYLNALRAKPDSRIILQYLITPWMMRRDYGTVADSLLPIAEANPHVLDLQLITAEALQMAERQDEAVSRLESSYYHAGSRDARLLRELSALYWRREQWEDLRRLLADAQINPLLKDNFATHYVLASYHAMMVESAAETDLPKRQARRHRQQALTYAKQAAAQIGQAAKPADIVALTAILVDMDDPETALRMLRDAQTEFPAIQYGLTLQIATLLNDLGRRDEALTEVQTMNLEAIDNPHVLLEAGRLLMNLDQLREAAEALDNVLKMTPDLLQARLLLAHIWLSLDEPDRALAVLERAEDLPVTGLVIKTQAYRQKRDAHHALAALEQARQQAEEAELDGFFTADYYLLAANVYEESGNYERARETAEKALAMSPDDPVVANNVGYLLADHNEELDRAEQLIRTAVEAEPDNIAYLDSLAWVLYRQQRFPEAMQQMEEILGLVADQPPDPVILDHAGDIYAANGRWEDAVRCWQQAIEADAQNIDAIRQKIESASAAAPTAD
jgi:tetratricopeptide (TPR) repeat protein